MNSKTLIWLKQIRAPFLILPVTLMAISGAFAMHNNTFHPVRLGLALIGILLAHISVNLLNEYHDDKSGIDHMTRRTPFSGGSGMIQIQNTTSGQVLTVSIASLISAFSIGLYLAWQSGWQLLALILIGGFIILTYTPLLSRLIMGELSAGLGLGSLIIIGGYYVQSGTINPSVILLSLPSGILTASLLLLNEFPDKNPDQKCGRKNLVTSLGYKKSALLYITALGTCYCILIAGVIGKHFPPYVLAALLTIPLAIKASAIALKHGKDFEQMISAQSTNVKIILTINLLIAAGCIIK